MTELHIDFETRSLLDLKVVGGYIYAMHPTTEPWCASYAFDDEPVKRWKKGEPCPPEIAEHIKKGGIIVAHNAAFERIIFNYIMGPRFGWPVPKLEQWRCTMAMAYAMNLPGSLEEAAAALGLKAQKDMSGRRLILQMAKPRKIEKCAACKGKGQSEIVLSHPTPTTVLVREDACIVCDGIGVHITWWDDEDRKARGMAYCDQDVEVERELGKRVLQLRPQEQQLWFLDQKINDRGVYIDADLCNQALKVVELTQTALDEEMREVTKGAVRSCGEVSNLVKFVNKELGAMPDQPLVASVNKEMLEELLTLWDLTPAARRALEIRQEAAKTSTAKIKKMLEMRAPDGRMRGNLQYHGAGTGRWAARGAQLQNLPRPKMKKEQVADAIETILETASPALISMLYGPPLSVVADCIRGMVAAPKGKDIVFADFAAIEARVLAWLAGQHDIVAAFAKNADIYSKQASLIYQRPIDRKNNPDHFTEGLVGKVAILALGYQGGADAFGKMAGNHSLKLEPLYDPVYAAATPENREKAEWGYQQRGKKSKLSEKAWIAAELIKLAWRDANPAIVSFWAELEDAAILAVKNPGKQYNVGGKDRPVVSYRVSGSFLWCRLPSGRTICYPYPRIKTVEVPWGTKEAVVYKAVNGVTKKWEEHVFYGGLAAENITQAVARDLMAEGMLRVEDAGYEVIITIHDEEGTEIPEGFGSVEEFEDLMAQTPEWAKGCPVNAEGWRGKRYRK